MKKYIEMFSQMEKKKKIIISVIAAAVIIGVIGGGAVFLGGRSEPAGAQSAESARQTNEFYQGLKDRAVVEKEEDPYDTRVDFDELSKVNEDIYAWIKIPETNIDYPILQSADQPDDYYLNHTVEKAETLPGSIYTEKYNVTGFTDPVTVIYGHTLNDGTMFSELKKFRDKEFFDKNPYIYIYFPAGRLKYQVFAAVAFDDRYILGSYAFQDNEDFEKYVTELKSCMDGNVNQDIAINNRIITLSTCIDEAPDQRWLVNAVLVEEEWY